MRLAEAGLTNTEFANAQKLAYFGLAQSVDGLWAITDKGRHFLNNEATIEKFVHTKQGRVVAREGHIRITDVDEGWGRRTDF